MNKKDLIISYIFALICIVCLTTVEAPTPYHLPIFSFLLLLFPILFAIRFKNEDYKQKAINKNIEFSKKYYIAPLYFFLATIFVTLIAGFYSGSVISTKYIVAIVKTHEKANDVITLLAKQNLSTEYHIIHNNKGDVRYVVTISRHEVNDEQYKEAILELENSPIIDDSVEIIAEEK